MFECIQNAGERDRQLIIKNADTIKRKGAAYKVIVNGLNGPFPGAVLVQLAAQRGDVTDETSAKAGLLIRMD